MGERISKMSVKSDIIAKIAELAALADQIVEAIDPSEQIAQLQAQVAALQVEAAAKDLIIADQAMKLAAVDLLAKQIDAAIPDA